MLTHVMTHVADIRHHTYGGVALVFYIGGKYTSNHGGWTGFYSGDVLVFKLERGRLRLSHVLRSSRRHRVRVAAAGRGDSVCPH